MALLCRNQTYTSDKIVDMHGKLDVSEEQHLWKNENGGSVEMTRVSQDRGISWEEAWNSYQAAQKAGRPAFFVKVRSIQLPRQSQVYYSLMHMYAPCSTQTKSAPFGYPQEERYKQYSLCIGMAMSGAHEPESHKSDLPSAIELPFLYEQDWIRHSGTPSKSLIWVSPQRPRCAAGSLASSLFCVLRT